MTQRIFLRESPRKIKTFPTDFQARKLSVNWQFLPIVEHFSRKSVELPLYGEFRQDKIRWKILNFTGWKLTQISSSDHSAIDKGYWALLISTLLLISSLSQFSPRFENFQNNFQTNKHCQSMLNLFGTLMCK